MAKIIGPAFDVATGDLSSRLDSLIGSLGMVKWKLVMMKLFVFART